MNVEGFRVDQLFRKDLKIRRVGSAVLAISSIPSAFEVKIFFCLLFTSVIFFKFPLQIMEKVLAKNMYFVLILGRKHPQTSLSLDFI